MCANYLPARAAQLQRHFGVEPPADPGVAEAFPGNMAPLIRRAEDGSGESECVTACFGLVPSWAELKLARHTYNARTETVAVKPAYRHAFRKQQFCIIPAAAFFEPSYESGQAVRWKIEGAGGAPLGIAGIWEWRPHGGADDRPLVSFSMLTINADEDPLMRRFHKPGNEKRMIVILPPGQYAAWLQADPADAAAFFQPFPAGMLHAVPAPRSPRTSKPALRKATARPRNLPLL